MGASIRSNHNCAVPQDKSTRHRTGVIVLLTIFAVALGLPAASTAPPVERTTPYRVSASAIQDDYSRVLQEATRTIRAAPNNAAGYLRRAGLYDSHDEYAK